MEEAATLHVPPVQIAQPVPPTPQHCPRQQHAERRKQREITRQHPGRGSAPSYLSTPRSEQPQRRWLWPALHQHGHGRAVHPQPGRLRAAPSR